MVCSSFGEQNSRGRRDCPGERVKGPLVLSTSCVVDPLLAGGRDTESNHSPCLKKPVANGGNRLRHQYCQAREKILLSQKRIYRGKKDYFQQQRRSQRCSEASEGRVLALSSPIDLRLEKDRWGSYLRVLLSPLLLLTEIPHIYNDNMQTFPPGGK